MTLVDRINRIYRIGNPEDQGSEWMAVLSP